MKTPKTDPGPRRISLASPPVLAHSWIFSRSPFPYRAERKAERTVEGFHCDTFTRANHLQNRLLEAPSRHDGEIIGAVLSHCPWLKSYAQDQLPFGRHNAVGHIAGEDMVLEQRVFCSFYPTRCINLQAEKREVNTSERKVPHFCFVQTPTRAIFTTLRDVPKPTSPRETRQHGNLLQEVVSLSTYHRQVEDFHTLLHRSAHWHRSKAQHVPKLPRLYAFMLLPWHIHPQVGVFGC